MLIQADSDGFCSNCYFLIAIKAAPSVQAEIIVSQASMPISLKEGSVLQDKLPNKNVSNIYQFYSINDFNITVGKVYGSISLTVTDPTGSQVIKDKVVDRDSLEVVI